MTGGVNKLLPTLVIGGYLGAGKTTLVNQMLRDAQGQRIAVLVNDFGDINIDADLIQGQSGDVLELSGGCVCCSFGADLVGSLTAVSQRSPTLDLVLIETSGVALPGAVARSARLVPGLNVLGVLTVLDASSIKDRANDRYVGSTVMQQITDANLLLLNKMDLLTPFEVAQTQVWLTGLKAAAPVVTSAQGFLSPDFWLIREESEPQKNRSWPQTPRFTPVEQANKDALSQFESRSLRWQAAQNVKLIQSKLDACPQILRAKGRIRDSDGAVWVLQKVGSMSTVLRCESPNADHTAGGLTESLLVLISLKGQMPDDIHF